MPVGVFAIAWLGTKLHFGNVLEFCRRSADLARTAKLRLAAFVLRAKVRLCMRSERMQSGHEMKSELRTDGDDLKRSLMA